MPNQLIVTIPANDPTLRRAVEQGVEDYADVRQSPSYTDLETVKLVFEVVGQGVGIAGGVASIVTFLRSLQQQQAQQGKPVTIIIEVPGGKPLPVADADAALLASLLAGEPTA